ncbi:hypothetical protein BUALT_Bualt08G0103100 [Buddleja alternifolia]|uniref:BZIP domain-containing protein n=1 Tax=Buddleja alternifolia TaxID=168488 RepID=A0AAV6XG31_9LAMI|nr:hypothetical protein BUALT_Bualt08G0103100 [Buddleja alternifolia]
MASSKVMASSNSDLKRKLSAHVATSSATDFLRMDSSGNARDNLVSDLRNSYVERNSSTDQGRRYVVEAESNSGALLNAEITHLDAVGAIAPISDGETERPVVVKKTVDDVWREIVAGKKSEQKPKQEMMTLEDFLVRAGAVEEGEESGKGAIVAVKTETLSGRIHSYDSNSGVIGMGLGMGMDVGGLERGRGKRSVSLLEPLDKAAQQRQRRMIKNRESAARSRERKQAYQVELESMAVRLEEENEQLLEEKAERTKKRLKQLMENVIPVVEKRKPPRLQKVRSMQW